MYLELDQRGHEGDAAGWLQCPPRVVQTAASERLVTDFGGNVLPWSAGARAKLTSPEARRRSRRSGLRMRFLVAVVVATCASALSPFTPNPAPSTKSVGGEINVARKMLELSEAKSELEVENAALQLQLEDASKELAEAQRIAALVPAMAKQRKSLVAQVETLENKVRLLEGASAALGNAVKKRDQEVAMLREANASLEKERRNLKALARNAWVVVATGFKRRILRKRGDA